MHAVRYPGAVPGVYLSRSNRFLARVLVDGQEVIAHIKTTGRCRELLVPGARVVVCPGVNPNRQTAWDLVAAYKGTMLVNIDSQAPNRLAGPWLWARFPGADIRAEFATGESRLDFRVRDALGDLFVEVKGCTLEKDGLALFPDAPTARGTRHLHTLEGCATAGHRALVLFVILMRPVRAFAPHDALDPAFGAALRRAVQAGVRAEAMDCIVTPDSIAMGDKVPVLL